MRSGRFPNVELTPLFLVVANFRPYKGTNYIGLTQFGHIMSKILYFFLNALLTGLCLWNQLWSHSPPWTSAKSSCFPNRTHQLITCIVSRSFLKLIRFCWGFDNCGRFWNYGAWTGQFMRLWNIINLAKLNFAWFYTLFISWETFYQEPCSVSLD